MRYYLGLGSNVGDSRFYLRRAIGLIEEHNLGKVIVKSSLYRTEPIGNPNQDWYLNVVAIVESEQSPGEMMMGLLEIEKKLGRKRERDKKNLPRTIDLDILLADDMIIQREQLIIPHPRMQERRFVLDPLAEIDPGLVHPLFKKTVRELLAEVRNSARVEKLNEKL